MSSPQKVWFVTGTSQGFGLELVRAALDRGDAVVATSRKPAEVAAAFPQAADRLLAVSLDLRDPASIAGTVRAALERFGRIDVLVNNAGYGIYGAVEEVSDEEAQAVFEINVFGLLRLTRAVLPSMRQRKAGHIVNLSSFGGLVGVPGAGIYCATKFALEGLSDSLAAEAAPLGVGVTLVEPGPFRTNFLGDSLVRAKEVIADYAETAGKARAALDTRHGNQAGDPVRAALAIVQAVTAPKPPRRLLLGRFAYEKVQEKFAQMQEEFSAWREVTVGADYPEAG